MTIIRHAIPKHFKWRLALAIFISALALGCENGNIFISDMYFICANPEAFSQEDDKGKNTYILNSQTQTVLVLTLGIATGNSIFSSANPGKYSIAFKFSKGNGEEKPLSQFRNSNGEQIAEIEDKTVKIRLNRIDSLSDYEISAYANNRKASFRFSVDSSETISGNLSLYYVGDYDDEFDDTNMISKKLKKEIGLQVSSTYAIICRNRSKLGNLEFSLDSNENLRMAQNAQRRQDDDSGSQCDETVYLVSGSKPNSKSVLTVSAGSKKKESFLISLEKFQDRVIPDPPPSLFLIPISNGYRVVARLSSDMISRKFNVMMNINNSETDIRLENKFTENEKLAGYFHDITCEGAYVISAYYRNSYLRTESSTICFSVEKDSILHKLSADALIRTANSIQTLSSISDNPLVKTITISLPPLSERMENIPESVPLKSYSPYQNLNLRVEISRNSTTIVTPHYDWEKGWSMSERVYGDDKDESITIKLKAEGILGKTAGDERIFIIRNEKQSHSCSLEYSGTCYEGNALKHKFALGISNHSNAQARLYYSYSEDGGKTFSALRCKSVGAGTQKIPLDKPDSAGFASKSVLFKAKIIQNGKSAYDIGILNAGSLKIAEKASLSCSDSIQDQPNIRKARITAPSGSCKVSYAISDSKDSNSDRLIFTPLDSSTSIITAIKADSDTISNAITKYIWLKSEDTSASDSYPMIERHAITLTAAAPAINENNKENIWGNEGIFGAGITLTLTAPMDSCYLRTKAYAENVRTDYMQHLSKAGDQHRFASDWDMCMAGYRHNRFAIVSFTRKNGYMDSQICEYCGECRSGSGIHNSDAEQFMEDLKKEWRCAYEI